MKVKTYEFIGLYIGIVSFSFLVLITGIFSGYKGLIAAALIVTANLITPIVIAFNKPKTSIFLAALYVLTGMFIFSYLNYIDLSTYWQKRLGAAEIFFALNCLYISSSAYLVRKTWFSANLAIALAHIPLILGFALFPEGAATFP